jgi:hypothetical protein
MSKINEYREILLKLKDWDDFLVTHSELPSPRANLELLHAAAEIGDEKRFIRYIEPGTIAAAVNEPEIFPLLVGLAGLGKLISEGNTAWFTTLAKYAGDERWRVREAVAMALQTVGDSNMELLLERMHEWKSREFYIQRAAVAGLCEPRLLRNKSHAAEVLSILKAITRNIEISKQSHDDSFKALRQALGYGISVAVVALPAEGKRFLEELKRNNNKDIRWILKENLSKNRLVKMDPVWVSEMISAF